TALSPTSTIVGRSFWSTCVSIGRPCRSLHAPASAAHPVHLDAPALAGFAQLGAQLAVAVGPRSPDVLQEPDELRVARSRAKRPAQVGAARREEARIELALGRQPCAVAVAAERLADRRDEADLALPVAEAVAGRDLAAVVPVERLERPARMDAVAEDLRRHDVVGAPAVQRADVHVLDEAQDHAGATEMLD